MKSTKQITIERAQWLALHVVPHEPALRAWLKRKGGLHCDVDDVVQETYAILATKASVDAILDPKTYTFQVAHSVILQQLRHARVVPITAVADIGTLEAVMDQPSPEDTVLARFRAGACAARHRGPAAQDARRLRHAPGGGVVAAGDRPAHEPVAAHHPEAGGAGHQAAAGPIGPGRGR
ncbi:hypothetical protein UAA55_17885 [Nitrospirillum sp. BR 11163]|nr:sigma factor [Nitrospirillum sp. BR 11163]MEA1675266.1 hypothetical protein [Nitrospirillum sp. BR 11163]